MRPKGWRQFADGTIAAPHRGKAPAAPEGYEATGDKFLFKPILYACEFRGEGEVKLKCCNKMKKVMWCNDRDIQITRLTCMRCPCMGSGQRAIIK